jgi:hypothetical protein
VDPTALSLPMRHRGDSWQARGKRCLIRCGTANNHTRSDTKKCHTRTHGYAATREAAMAAFAKSWRRE